jgi:hypothetical protein
MPARMVLGLMIGLFLASSCSLLTCGHDFSKGPLKNGCRKTAVIWLYMFTAKLFMMVVSVNTKVE